MRIYVASSWRNPYQPEIFSQLKADGHEVYDFREKGFSWSEVDECWLDWVNDTKSYLSGLNHPRAIQGFNKDMKALEWSEACVYVMPCGVSASWEAGYAVGAKKRVFVFVPGLREPDLMVKMAELVTDDFNKIRSALR